MNTLPDIDELRHALKRRMTEKRISQVSLSKQTDIHQPNLSFFLSGKRGLSYANAIKLWRYAYGEEFPNMPDRQPASAE